MPAKVVKKKNLSALKRARQAEKRNERNRMERTRIKNVMKAVETSVSAGDKDASDRSLKMAVKTIDTARLKGVIHKNNAARKISKLTRKVNTLEKPASA